MSTHDSMDFSDTVTEGASIPQRNQRLHWVLVVVLGVGVFGVLQWVLNGIRQADRPPDVFVDSVVQLGSVEAKSHVLELKLRNASNMDYKFDGVHCNCSCMSVVSVPEALAAGESGQLKLRWNLEGKIGETSEAITLFVNKKSLLYPCVAEVRASIVSSDL